MVKFASAYKFALNRNDMNCNRLYLKFVFVLTLFVCSTLIGLAQKDRRVVYVDILAKGENDGSSWVNAYTNLQIALRDSSADEIWVAQGIYTPIKDEKGASASGFIIDELYTKRLVLGGFRGGEISSEQRDPEMNLTILECSGNCEVGNLVIYSKMPNRLLVFDGFTISVPDFTDNTFISRQLEVVEMVNCWIGAEQVNNHDQFTKSEMIDKLSFTTENSGIVKSFETESVGNNQVSVYPAVATTKVNIEAVVPSKVQIINYLGGIVKQMSINASPMTVDVSSLDRGLYIIRVYNESNGVKTFSLVLQ